jgi:hypothetical protein
MKKMMVITLLSSSFIFATAQADGEKLLTGTTAIATAIPGQNPLGAAFTVAAYFMSKSAGALGGNLQAQVRSSINQYYAYAGTKVDPILSLSYQKLVDDGSIDSEQVSLQSYIAELDQTI